MTHEKENPTVFDNIMSSISEWLKTFDTYHTKANFKISHKDKSDGNAKRYHSSVGSVYGGILSLIAKGIFMYLFISGV